MRLPYNVDIESLQYSGGAMGVFTDKFGATIRMAQAMGYSWNPTAYPYGYHQGIDTSASVRFFEHVFPERVRVVRAVKNMYYTNTGFGNYVDAIGLESGYHHRFGHHADIYVDEGKEYPKGFIFGTEDNSGYQVPKYGAWHLHWDIAKNGKRMSSSECSQTAYLSQFVDPLQLVLQDLEQEKMEMIYKKKYEEVCRLFAEISMTASPHLTQHALSSGFITQEMLDMNSDNPAWLGIVTEIYKALLGRSPDEEGLKFHKGHPVIQVFRDTVNSSEFQNKK